MPDGSIVFSTELNNKDLERQLVKSKREIEKLNAAVQSHERKKTPLVRQAEELGAKLKTARAEMQKYGEQWKGGVAGADKSQSNAATAVRGLEAQYAGVVGQIDKIDEKLIPSYEKMNGMKESASGLEKKLAVARDNSTKMGTATKRAEKNMDRFNSRMREVIRSALVFTVISQALSKFRDWVGSVVKTNDKATAAVARLKGALLTLAQPLVEVIIPAFTALVNVLTDIVMLAASVVATLFGTTIKEASKSAEELNNEKNALEGVGDEAKKASKALTGFDEINKLSDGTDTSKASNDGIMPDFSVADKRGMDWLTKTLGNAAGYVTSALLLGGIALVAVGACMGNIPLVVSGLAMLGVGVMIGSQTGVLQSWADALGLNGVEEFIAVAVALGGIAIVAVGAAMGNVFMVLAGLGIIWGSVSYASSSGTAGNWTERQVSKAASFVTAALLLGAIVLVAVGASTANVLMVLAGLGMLSAGVYVGVKSGVLKSWAESLDLNSVFDYVTAAVQLAGIALIAIGAAMGNIFMVLAGAALIAIGIVAENVGQQTLQNWWETLKLTSVQQWVSVALMLVGVVLIAVGAVMANVTMVITGAAILGFSTIVATQNNNLKDWVETLGLEKVSGWVTAGLMLAGMAFVVFGIVTANVLMVIAGIGMIGAGIVLGITSGTIGSWVDALRLDEVSGWVSTALSLAGIALIAIGAATLNPLLVIAGLGLLGTGIAVHALSSNTPRVSQPSVNMARTAAPSIASYDIPALATGAVIPPNNEFLAVLGDQKQGRNFEAPEGLLRQIVAEEVSRNGGGANEIILRLVPGPGFVRDLNLELDGESRRRGVKLVTGGVY